MAGYAKPATMESHYDVFAAVALALANGDADAIDPASLWDGLEAFPAYGDEVELAPLRRGRHRSAGPRP